MAIGQKPNGQAFMSGLIFRTLHKKPRIQIYLYTSVVHQKDDIPLKTQQPTPWNLCCLMRGIQCFSHNEGDLVCSLNEMGFSTLPIRKLSSICCFIFGFCLYFFSSLLGEETMNTPPIPQNIPLGSFGADVGIFHLPPRGLL